jgi:hypothetical protein
MENRFLQCVLEDRRERAEARRRYEKPRYDPENRFLQAAYETAPPIRPSERMVPSRARPMPHPVKTAAVVVRSYEEEFPTLIRPSNVILTKKAEATQMGETAIRASKGWVAIAKNPTANTSDPLEEPPVKPVNPLYVLPPQMIAYKKKEEEQAKAMKLHQRPAERVNPHHESEIVYDEDGFPYYQE